jgi:hypothetical protein
MGARARQPSSGALSGFRILGLLVAEYDGEGSPGEDERGGQR